MLKKKFGFLRSKPVKIIVMVVGIFFIFFGWVIWSDATNQRQNELNPNSGQITSMYKIDPSKPIYIYLGGAGNNFTAQDLVNGIDLNRLIHFGNFTFPLKITFDSDGKIQVSAQITDERGNLLANIIDNQWEAPNPPQIWDKNYNSYAFEVKDENGIPILQVIMGSQNEILIGISTYHEGVPYFGIIIRGFNFFSDYYTNGFPQGELEDLRNQTIFYYPSSQHLGQLKEVPNWSTFPPTFQTFPENNPLIPSTFGFIVGGSMAIIGGCIDAFVVYDTATQRQKGTNVEKATRRKGKKR
jgi:hypothetical protein